MAALINVDELIKIAEEMFYISKDMKGFDTRIGNMVNRLNSVHGGGPELEFFTEKYIVFEDQLADFCVSMNSFADKILDHAFRIKHIDDEGVV